MKKIWLSSPHMGGSELKYIQQAFETNWIAPLGPNVDAFEQLLQNFVSTKHAAALSSGTSAIHLALELLDVKYGDYVICQSFTFSASANPILYQGAIPVFVDSEAETWNMSPLYLELAIKECIKRRKKPKAIIVVHLYGMPSKMHEIIDIANLYEIPIIEDAAEALGSHINGKKCGSFGQFGVLSFNGNKIITTSGGGALLSDEESFIIRARYLATQARDPAPHYEHSVIGYNYRMSNICAGIGRGQMEVLNSRIIQRRQNFEFYKKRFTHIPYLKFNTELPGYFSNRWLSCILIDVNKDNKVTREDVRLTLEALNIESRPLWKPMHIQPVFAGSLFFGANVSESLFNKGLCLPSGSNLTMSDLELVGDTIDRLFK